MNETGKTNGAIRNGEGRKFRPKLTFYHANAKGTGSAIQFELHPAHDDTDGSIMVSLANQATVGDSRGGGATAYPRFDWENALYVKLEFADLTKLLQVFRGECESIEDGKGLCHRGLRGTSFIHLRHVKDEQWNGYTFEVRRTQAGGEEKSARIFLRPNEALGLLLAIEGAMSVLCFGIPLVIPRDTQAYRAAIKESQSA